MSNPDLVLAVTPTAVDGHPTATQIVRATWATRFQFAALGIMGGAWGVHIPSVKAQYQLGEAALSFVLVAAACGAVLSLLFAGRVIAHLGARRANALAVLVMGSMLALALRWPSYTLLLASMLAFGASMSLYDVAINTEGSALEVLGKRAIMGNLHGMFSVGGMLGAAITGAMLRAQVSPALQLAGLGACMAALVVLVSQGMLATHPSAGAAQAKAHFAWPRGTLLVIGLLAFAGMSAEGVMYDWCVLYLKQEVHMPQDQAALGYAAFSAAMALTRFGGDALRARYSERLLLRLGGATAALSMAALLWLANPWVSIVGYALVGVGLAQVVPILFNAATRVPGTSPAAAIASISSIGYAGFMVGPPLIGGLAQNFSLTVAMLVVVLAAGALAVWAHRVPERA